MIFEKKEYIYIKRVKINPHVFGRLHTTFPNGVLQRTRKEFWMRSTIAVDELFAELDGRHRLVLSVVVRQKRL